MVPSDFVFYYYFAEKNVKKQSRTCFVGHPVLPNQDHDSFLPVSGGFGVWPNNNEIGVLVGMY